jgi:hypothetical protein
LVSGNGFRQSFKIAVQLIRKDSLGNKLAVLSAISNPLRMSGRLRTLSGETLANAKLKQTTLFISFFVTVV